jgi:tRNA(Ile)-lysidine synthase
MSNFLKKIKASVEKLIAPQDRVLVAVSGGIDSLALLHLLEQFSREFGFNLFVAHLNHLSRGSESDADAKFVEKEAGKLSLPIFINEIDVRKEKPLLKTSFQESARILRYQFLEKTLVSIEGNKIAVGHNADDQIETVLMNLLRGTGLRGLSGIPEKRGNIIRPLLGCTRTELELYLNSQNLKYRTDSSNKEKKYLRNEIRHDLVPLLKRFNNDISGNLLDLAEIAREEDEWMSEKTNDLFSQLVIAENERLSFNISDFQKQAPAMKRRLAREALYRLKGSLRSITALHIQQVLDLCFRARVGSRLKLPGKLGVSCDYDTVNFFLSDEAEESSPPEKDQKNIRLKVPGVTSLSGGRFQLYTGLMKPPVTFPKPSNENQAYLDFEKTGELIHARFFQPGDHFVPLGMQGHKKLKSYFIDRKIPRDQRSAIPVLTNADNDIIWIYGERISDRFRITAKTRKVLFIAGKGL